MSLVPGKLRADPGERELDGRAVVQRVRGQAEDVRIELLATLEGGRGVCAGSGPDPSDLVGGDGGSHAAAADEHAGLDEVAQHRLADFACTVGIVDGLGGGRAQVQHHVTAGLEGREKRPF
jgi:hypothetical protein